MFVLEMGFVFLNQGLPIQPSPQIQVLLDLTFKVLGRLLAPPLLLPAQGKDSLELPGWP